MATPTPSIPPEVDTLIGWLPALVLAEWLFAIAAFLTWCLILWPIIFFAVRAALRSHSRWTAEEDRYQKSVSRAQRLEQGRQSSLS